ncbi:hypothetical protein V6N12_035335 [Hibiscus sabdariffa]|uniref:Uncharacterized protein n=1 Tax=Hibiscus sabdariffa TaxID=183260 RepID=A0ABR2BSR6_9ROSI
MQICLHGMEPWGPPRHLEVALFCLCWNLADGRSACMEWIYSYKPYPSLPFNPSPALINLLNIHPLFSNYEPYPNLPSIPCKQICHRSGSSTGRTRPPRGGEVDPTAPFHASRSALFPQLKPANGFAQREWLEPGPGHLEVARSPVYCRS